MNVARRLAGVLKKSRAILQPCFEQRSAFCRRRKKIACDIATVLLASLRMLHESTENCVRYCGQLFQDCMPGLRPRNIIACDRGSTSMSPIMEVAVQATNQLSVLHLGVP